MPNTTITIDLTKIDEKEFDPKRPLRVAAIRDGKIIDQKTVTPAKEKNPRQITVDLSLGDPQDGVAGAEISVAPADDERNVHSKLAARKFVTSAGAAAAARVIVNPGIYGWWRFCWFPRTYRVTGRVVRNAGDCVHPIAGANVEIYDVDYCWWWFNQDLLQTGHTDVNGFFDINFTWCVPLWCLFEILRVPFVTIDPDLRDRIRAIVDERLPIKFPPPPPPPDPWEWERQLTQLGVELPAAARVPVQDFQLRGVRQMATVAGSESVFTRSATLSSKQLASSSALALSGASAAARATISKTAISAADLFRPIIFWPPCDDPCDWYPDIKIRVTQPQPGGTVVIYEDTWWQIHYDQPGDLLNLTLEANSSAIYADDCGRGPILGNCMLLDSVGDIQIMPTLADPLSGIYQPDVVPGTSYGVTPDRRQRLGYVKNYDRPFAGVVSVYGRFGIAAHVDYYQVQMAKWTDADLLAWDADHSYVPPDAAFAAVPATALPAFQRSYLEESPLPLHWNTETFGPNTVSGIPLLYKSRERFEQEYRDSHGGNDPAPDFGGWYWYYFTQTRLFDVDSSQLANGYYTFRFICYQQTGVDGMGNPILAPVTMGLPGGLGKRCTTSKPELVTLYLHDDTFVADCKILNFTKNGVTTVDECAMVTLTSSDWLEVEYQAFDAAGNLDSYAVTLQKGASAPHDLISIAGVTAISGTTPEGPTYGLALVEIPGATPPYWYGGTWRKKIPYSSFVAMGGSCAYNLRVTACDRHTTGFTSACSLAECDKNRAFTIILA